jgi:hypothetical protein
MYVPNVLSFNPLETITWWNNRSWFITAIVLLNRCENLPVTGLNLKLKFQSLKCNALHFIMYVMTLCKYVLHSTRLRCYRWEWQLFKKSKVDWLKEQAQPISDYFIIAISWKRHHVARIKLKSRNLDFTFWSVELISNLSRTIENLLKGFISISGLM